MSRYSRTHLSDATLGQRLSANAAHDHAHTAELLADIAEFDARRLYLPAAHPSMHSYCVRELHFSDDAALKRIRAARAARKAPAIFEMVASGRLHLSGVVLLAPYLTPDNADELLAAATHETKAGIELLLAQRFPRPDAPTRIEAIGPLGQTPMKSDGRDPGPVEGLLSGLVPEVAPGPVECAWHDRVTPLSPRHFRLQVTLEHDAHVLLCRAQELLGHQVPSGDIGEVLRRALDSLVRHLEKRKLAATDRPCASRRRSTNPRYIPAHVRRGVWERDGGQCTFVSATGQRCPARTRLELDHVEEVARGGRATVDGIRLRCRAHNQYTAERTFGVEFMKRKREQMRRAEAEGAQAQVARCTASAPVVDSGTRGELAGAQGYAGAQMRAAQAPEALATAVWNGRDARRVAATTDAKTGAAEPSADERDVVPWLRRLGFRAEEVRSAGAFCARMPEASLEERIRAALGYLRPRRPSRRHEGPETSTC